MCEIFIHIFKLEPFIYSELRNIHRPINVPVGKCAWNLKFRLIDFKVLL